MKLSSNRRVRRGATIPYLVILLVPLLGMVAFAVDVGWMTATKSDLQNAADAAALAGAGPLMDGYVEYNLPKQTSILKEYIKATAMANAKSKVKTYGGYNAAGGVSSLKVNDSDIEFGFTDASGNYAALTAGSSLYPNTVKVTVRRDGSANGSLGLFFGRILGTKEANLTATAAATIYVTDLNSFQYNAPANMGVLPMTYDVDDWDHFIQTGRDADGLITVDTSGNPTLKVYESIKHSGNMGLLSLNDSDNNASTNKGWIQDGVGQNDLNQLLNRNLVPLDKHNSSNWDWSGSPGLKQSNIADLTPYIGQVYALPLFKANHPGDEIGHGYEPGIGQGQNYDYQVVRFVPVKIVRTAHATVIVQPAAMVLDPNIIVASQIPLPAGTSTSTSQTFFLPPKLSQ